MIHLLNKPQVWHDRWLELAAKKHQYEDEHVTLMRKAEEDIIWNWWKVSSMVVLWLTVLMVLSTQILISQFERDDLQMEMYLN